MELNIFASLAGKAGVVFTCTVLKCILLFIVTVKK